MPLLKKWEAEGAVWGIWQVSESVDELRTMLTEASVDATELVKYKCTGRKLEYLATRVLLKELTGREQCIAHFPSGKPYLPESALHITVSHTKGYVALGIHPTKEIGIDIEQVAERVRNVTSRFLRDDELPGLSKLKNQEQLYELLLVWSAKETMFKVLNASEVDFLQHLQVEKIILQSAGNFTGREYRTMSQSVYNIHYQIHSDFVLTYLVDTSSHYYF